MPLKEESEIRKRLDSLGNDMCVAEAVGNRERVEEIKIERDTLKWVWKNEPETKQHSVVRE